VEINFIALTIICPFSTVLRTKVSALAVCVWIVATLSITEVKRQT